MCFYIILDVREYRYFWSINNLEDFPMTITIDIIIIIIIIIVIIIIFFISIIIRKESVFWQLGRTWC